MIIIIIIITQLKTRPCYLIVIHLWNTITPKRCKRGGKLVLITNRKSYMSFRLVPKSMTLKGEIALIMRDLT